MRQCTSTGQQPAFFGKTDSKYWPTCVDPRRMHFCHAGPHLDSEEAGVPGEPTNARLNAGLGLRTVHNDLRSGKHSGSISPQSPRTYEDAALMCSSNDARVERAVC